MRSNSIAYLPFKAGIPSQEVAQLCESFLNEINPLAHAFEVYLLLEKCIL